MVRFATITEVDAMNLKNLPEPGGLAPDRFYTRRILCAAPPAIWLGPGTSRLARDWAQARGLQSTLLVTAPPLERRVRSLAEEWEPVKGTISVLPDGEPDADMVFRLAEEIHASQADFVAAVGGGSVMDAAKLAVAAQDGWRPLVGSGTAAPGKRSVPLICIPTTSGTGSEVSPNALLVDTGTGKKTAVVSPWLVPDAAFVDAELTLTLPPRTTAMTAADAFVHCLEAFANRNSHPIVDLYASEGMRLVYSHMREAVANGSSLSDRAALAAGSLLGGLCLGPVNTAAVHALAYPLTERYRLPHGLAVAVLAPTVVRWILESAPRRYAEAADAIGLDGPEDPEARARWFVDAIEAKWQECGLPVRLAEIGASQKDQGWLAEQAVQIQRLLRNNLREVTLEGAMEIYSRAFG